jgi:processive 1,2-diacylglycerol beta-glucosyltransferase
MRILILTAGYGEGHNSAARGIQSALARSGSQAVVEYHDLFAETYTWFHPWVRKSYLGLINNWPRAWGYVYNWLDRKTDFPADFRKFKRLRENLRQLLQRFQPDAVVSVFPAYPYILEPLLQGTKTRSIAVVTDSITVNAIWYRSTADFFILPNEQSADVLRRAGIAESRIKVLGFPVDPRFTDLPRRPAPSADHPARVLYMINAGTKRAPETARLLSRLNIQLTVTVGHDEDLRKRIEAAVAPTKVEIVGWCSNLPELLCQHHLLVGKAGGATVQETITAACPMIVNHIVSGQEEGNAQLLLETGSGLIAREPAEVARAVEEMFANDAAGWREKAENISRISRPRAALDIAEFLMTL